MNWLNELKGFWNTMAGWFRFGYPPELSRIAMADLNRLLKASFPDCDVILLSDVIFSLTSKDQAQAYLARHINLPYVSEGHDCDNFSASAWGYFCEGLKSFAFGVTWSSTHAFNFMVDNERRVWLYEPQTNEVFALADKLKDKNYYPVRFLIC